jgi:cytochrome b
MSVLRQLRKLVLGETWSLPLGVAGALAVAGIMRALDGDRGWWHHAGGFILLALVAVALTWSLAGALRARGK